MLFKKLFHNRADKLELQEPPEDFNSKPVREFNQPFGMSTGKNISDEKMFKTI